MCVSGEEDPGPSPKPGNIWMDFCVSNFLRYGYPVDPVLFIDKIALSPLICTAILIINIYILVGKMIYLQY